MSKQAPIENCYNCGRVIGRLETPMVVHPSPQIWHVVCGECHQRLKHTGQPPAAEAATASGGKKPFAQGSREPEPRPQAESRGAPAGADKKRPSFGPGAMAACGFVFLFVAAVLGVTSAQGNSPTGAIPAALLCIVGSILLFGSLLLVFIRWVTREAVKEAKKS